MHKHEFTIIAHCINKELMRESEPSTMKRLIDDLCDEFIKDNPLFKREAFIEACWKGVV